ncbi:SPW repeat protein [Halosimplex marinum]|uniref:SPW repeat protein n=1 Tax=Halosimplex marinum TaxID=3396620 RepID=UPI003F57DC67
MSDRDDTAASDSDGPGVSDSTDSGGYGGEPDDDAGAERDRDQRAAGVDTEEPTVDTNPAEHGKWVSLATALLGAYLVVSPWLFALEFGDTMGFNSVVVGVTLALLGGYNYARRAGERLGSVAAAGFVGLLGLWLLVSPWLFELDPDAAVAWNYVATGLLAGVLALYSGYEARDTDVETPTE